MTKIVVDTSVLISALIGKKGPSRQILRKCLNGVYQPVISTALFLEYEDVHKRPRIEELCPLEPGEIRELLNAFYSVCEWVHIHYLWRPNLKDESDNFLIELAIASNSQYLVTNNTKDLTGAELTFKHLAIVRPEQLLEGE
ncbi:MAG: putative toxin-antitoxin system toxin component, PIN family [Gammaproteobacteria bacterium]|nr:MAG: putative toxin-antitoxin system toxin component, PIN family [Gammaproteobacteria bacterium]